MFSTWLNFSHAFFPLNSQKPLPVRNWKHSFTNKENRKEKVRTLPNMTQMNYISLNRNCEIFFLFQSPHYYVPHLVDTFSVNGILGSFQGSNNNKSNAIVSQAS